MIPKPGSNAARAQGCTCPVLDNLEGGDLLGLYWMDLKCPVHGREGAMRKLLGKEEPVDTVQAVQDLFGLHNEL